MYTGGPPVYLCVSIHTNDGLTSDLSEGFYVFNYYFISRYLFKNYYQINSYLPVTFRSQQVEDIQTLCCWPCEFKPVSGTLSLEEKKQAQSL